MTTTYSSPPPHPPTPRHYPSPPCLSHSSHHSSPLHQPGGAWQAGSYRQRGCRGWSTCPAGGVWPVGSTRRAPGPAEEWAAGNPQPARLRRLCHPAGRSSTETFHEAAPGQQENGRGDGWRRSFGVFSGHVIYSCLYTDKEVESPQYDFKPWIGPLVSITPTVRLHRGHSHTRTHTSVCLYCSCMSLTKEVQNTKSVLPGKTT